MSTLASLNINHRIVRTPFDISSVPLCSVIHKMKESRDSLGKVHGDVPLPDREAIEFYTINHLIADLQIKKGEHCELSKEEESLVIMYFDILNSQAVRAFYYLMAICTRESRHSVTVVPTQVTKPTALEDFHDDLKSKSSFDSINYLFGNAPDVSVGNYVSFLEFVFSDHEFSSEEFGGPMWAEVAKVLSKCVHGELSLELMVDCAYNLSHNNGPIFNKGMWYLKHKDSLIKVLDVQRSGQMPTFLDTQIIYTNTVRMSELLYLGKIVSPELFKKKHVDWFAVEESGSVGNYGKEKTDQIKVHGLPKGNPPTELVGGPDLPTNLQLGFGNFISFKKKRSAV